ncbi:MAG TPA: rhomboid family intramembrane serine protease [Fibrobacteria bacterium]|nr:rhomboid family intramembrane serine protease [Fibrobacteria bacterium]
MDESAPEEEIPADIPGRKVLVHSSRKEEILDLSLMLASQGIKHWMAFDGQEFVLTLEEGSMPLARQLIDLYRAENESFRGEEAPTGNLELFTAPLFHLAIPVAVYFWVGLKPWGHWLERQGLADAAEILDGEWWRCLTATTLHADHEHFLGNILSGFFILNLLNHRLGMGTIMVLSTLGAGLTNFLVALAAGSEHRSLGFSSVVFCALGLLAAVETTHLPRSRGRGLRQFAPLLAAFFIAVMVGLGENADVKAHFYGFGVGAALGFLSRYLPSVLARPPWQFGLIFLVYGIHVLAWALATGLG